MKKLWSVLLILFMFVQITALPVSAGGATDNAVYFMQCDESSEYGYADYKFVDEDGNELVLNSENTQTQAEYYAEVWAVAEDTGIDSVALPTEYDSRDFGYVTPVKYQGSSGTCWAFAAISAIESDSIVQGFDTAETADYSEAHLIWFAKNSYEDDSAAMTYGDGTNNSDPYGGEDTGGNWTDVTSALSRWSGVAEESEYPFDPYDLTVMGNYEESSRYDTDSNVILKSTETLVNETDIKRWIMNHGAITASYHNDTTYLNNQTYAYYCDTDKTVNHAITIVGWDDNYSVANFNSSYQPSVNGAWLCKNSWSTMWGIDGYFWISYEDVTLTEFMGFTTDKANEFYNNYTYNGDGYSGFMTGTTVANVFEAKTYEVLSHVSTYTAGTNTDITISIYTSDAEDVLKPESGTLRSTWTVNVPNSGYHTLEVPDDITLEPGTKFCVVMEINCLDGTTYIPFEKCTSDKTFAGRDGESYIKRSGRWLYSRYYFNCCNFCIQALTKPILEHQSGVFMNFKENLIISPTNDFSYIKENVGIFGDNDFSVTDIADRNINCLATGATISVVQSDGTSVVFNVVVTGDLNGDGVCDVLDATFTERITNGHINATDLEIYAANGCVADSVDISDYQAVVNLALLN